MELKDIKKIKKLFFEYGYGIDAIANYFKDKYTHGQVRCCIMDLIGD